MGYKRALVTLCHSSPTKLQLQPLPCYVRYLSCAIQKPSRKTWLSDIIVALFGLTAKRSNCTPRRRGRRVLRLSPVIYIHLHHVCGSRDSSVGIATGYGLDDREVELRVPVGSRIFCSPSRPDQIQPPIQWVPETLSPGVKRPEREADHSPPASAEVKKIWIYTSTSPYSFVA
jgi:hypothetical protein